MERSAADDWSVAGLSGTATSLADRQTPDRAGSLGLSPGRAGARSAPEFPGLTDLAEEPPNLNQLASNLETALANLFEANQHQPEPLQPSEQAAVQERLAESTYKESANSAHR